MAAAGGTWIKGNFKAAKGGTATVTHAQVAAAAGLHHGLARPAPTTRGGLTLGGFTAVPNKQVRGGYDIVHNGSGQVVATVGGAKEANAHLISLHKNKITTASAAGRHTYALASRMASTNANKGNMARQIASAQAASAAKRAAKAPVQHISPAPSAPAAKNSAAPAKSSFSSTTAQNKAAAGKGGKPTQGHVYWYTKDKVTGKKVKNTSTGSILGDYAVVPIGSKQYGIVNRMGAGLVTGSKTTNEKAANAALHSLYKAGNGRALIGYDGAHVKSVYDKVSSAQAGKAAKAAAPNAAAGPKNSSFSATTAQNKARAAGNASKKPYQGSVSYVSGGKRQYTTGHKLGDYAVVKAGKKGYQLVNMATGGVVKGSTHTSLKVAKAALSMLHRTVNGAGKLAGKGLTAPQIVQQAYGMASQALSTKGLPG